VAQDRPRRSGQRRVKVPGIEELFRQAPASPVEGGRLDENQRPASGREGHSHKITVYLSSAELLELEQAKLTLRGYGISADRGRIVRESLAVLIADLEAVGDESLLVRRLREEH
jgi:hypothetical protein